MASRKPRLDTERSSVVLEPWSHEHKEGLLAAADDERITRFMTNQFPYPYRRSWSHEWTADS